MSAPSRRVLAFPVAAGLGPIEHRFDATADAPSRFRLSRPDRLEALEHEAGIHRSNRQLSHDRVDVGRKSVSPLLTVLRVFPGSFVRGDHPLGTGFERHSLRGLEAGCGPPLAPGDERISAVEEQSAGLAGLLTSLA